MRPRDNNTFNETPALAGVVRMRVALLVAVLVGVFLAGCLGGGEDDVGTEPDATPRTSEETGSVTGQVFDEDLNPVKGANVWVIDAQRNLVGEDVTRNDGRYTVNDIPPGKYRVQVSAICCKQEIRDIAILANEVLSDQNFMLVIVPDMLIMDPFVEGPIPDSGIIGCSHGITLLWVHCGATDPNHKDEFSFDIAPGLRTLTVGVDWKVQPSSYYGANPGMLNIRIELLAPGTGLMVLHDKDVEGPFELRLDESSMEGEITFEDLDEIDTAVKIMVRAPDLTVVYQQKFDVYYSMHYWHEAPPGYSVIPDA
jgi:hypothetical protein